MADNYTITPETLFEDFETFGDWTRQSAGGSIADETTIVKVGSHSLKLTAASASNCFADKVISASLVSAGVIGFYVYVPTLTGITSVAIYLSSTTNYSKYFLKTIAVAALHEGWNFVQVANSSWTNTGGEDWANTFLRVRFRINASSGTPSIYVDGMYTNISRRPKLLLTFDDGWDSVFTKAYSYMRNLGLVGTSYTIASKVGTSGYITKQQMMEMYDGGWSFSVHGETNLTTIATQAEMETEIASNRAYLLDNRFLGAEAHYAYPNGGYNDAAKLALAALNFKTARTIIDANQSHTINEPYLLTRLGIYNTTSVATATGYVDSVIDSCAAGLFNFHIIVDSDADVSTKVLTADFQEIIDYIKTKVDAGLIDVVTISEWFDGLEPREPIPFRRTSTGGGTLGKTSESLYRRKRAPVNLKKAVWNPPERSRQINVVRMSKKTPPKLFKTTLRKFQP